ncbi:FUSC family protein [Azospirillum picis]|uniref:Membrane protein YccC n=1 Tax=Azospirillum picis TaxID=488438 RepID=A0ABU0MQE8_9PROT|nr:FUSC family protein [Azospirillum picis]MBP2302012.1 putative membrane protein YccC [Azospirillum picis]MDQ0535697.1 putative membrane protein YccC [Azospirillum picis]
MRHWFAANRSKLIHALRMTISCLAAFALAAALALPQAFWAVITAIIVTQSSVGGSLKAALDRFVGSLLGVVYGCAVAILMPHGDPPARALALLVAVAPLSFFAAISAGLRVAPITAIIVLLGTSGASLGPLGFATDRVLEVGLGCVVGVLVSVLVVPARASRSVLVTAAEVARLLARQLDALAADGSAAEGNTDGKGQADMNALALRTRKALTRLETLVGEAARERRSRLADLPDPDPLLRTLMRLRHDVVMLRRAVWEPSRNGAPEWSWAPVAAAAAARLGSLADALAAGLLPAPSDALAGALADYRTAIDGMRKAHRTRDLPTDMLWRLFGAGFALEQASRNLADLEERVADFAARP